MKPIKMQQLYDALSRLYSNEKNSASRYETSEIPHFNAINSRDITIMIVEDNAVNLFLAKTILNEIVPQVKLVEARNGRLAVDQFLKTAPDLILMDVQMPVMNGYEAAAAIRKLETGPRIPIIALTAGTVKGEKDKCLTAGMDDYVTKPVVRDTVVKVIGKWLYHSVELTNSGPQSENSVSDMHFNATNLKIVIGDDMEFFEELLSLAKVNLKSLLPELNESVKNQDVKAIQRIARKMKGTALSACFDLLTGHLKQLEDIELYVHKDVADAANSIREEIEYLYALPNNVRY
jgi:CheY-like chemotaxis protein